MRYDEQEYVVKKAIRKRQPLPDWYVDQPTLLLFETFYLQAFQRLSSEPGRGNSVPFSKIVEYGERYGLDSDMIEPFCSIIWALNSTFQDYQRKQQERSQFVDKPSPAKRAKNK